MLAYRQCTYGGDWREIEEPVYVAYTVCNCGGQRVWFEYPSCGRRFAKPYIHVPYLVCCQCCGPPSNCQDESLSDRVCARLGGYGTNLMPA